MSKIKHSKNIVTAHIDANGNVIVGDGNNITVINLKEAAQYKHLEAEIEKLNTRFERTQQRIEKYPDDQELTVELLEIDEERGQKIKDRETLKQEVIKLAEDFARIPINTERLRKAKVHFESGEFVEARAVLNAEQMEVDLDTVIQREELGKAIQEQAKEDRKNLANEYLILARLTGINFELRNRFEKSVEHFEQSLRAERNVENVFAYAHFLQEHNQYLAATPLYEEALGIYQFLTQSNPQVFLPCVAMTLNDFANLYCAKNDLDQAEVNYEEALNIYRSLGQSNQQVFLPHIATTLNNLANLHCAKNELNQAEVKFKEALSIRKSLAQSNPQVFLPTVATTLNNLANLHGTKNEFDQAEVEYAEALSIYRPLAQSNPQSYLPYLASILNNLGNLLSEENKLDQAEVQYAEALSIQKLLSQINPKTLLPDVALTLFNLGNLYRDKNELGKAELQYLEAAGIQRLLVQYNPQAFLPDLAMTFNGLAGLHCNKNELEQAEAHYEKALEMFRSLAETNPQAFQPYVAMTAINFAIFYQDSLPDQERSLEYAKECIYAGMPFWEILPSVQNYVRSAINVVQQWGLDFEKFLKEI